LTSRAQTGRYGERVAASFLTRRGYRVLLRNYRAAPWEIDLICREGEVLAFVEVRTLARLDFGRPVETITGAKEDPLRQAARAYLAQLENPQINSRFDLVEVVLLEGEKPACTLHRDFMRATPDRLV
jgi:putative endonuclease